MREDTKQTIAVRLEALKSDRSSRAAGTAPVRITVENQGRKEEETVLGTNEVLEGLDRLINLIIMGSAFTISASISCNANAGTTTCRILESIASALNTTSLDAAAARTGGEEESEAEE